MEDVAKNWTADVGGQGIKDALLFYKQKAAYRFASWYVKGKIAVDYGCGSGYGAYLLSKWAKYVVGVDSNEDAIKYCQQRYKRDNLTFSHNKVSRADVVTCFQVLEHVKDPDEFIRLLKKIGCDTVIITTPNRDMRWMRRGEEPWNEEHVKEYDFLDLKLLLNNHFDDVDYGGIHGSPDAEFYEKMRTNGSGFKFPVSRSEGEGWGEDDFTVGPVQGALDLLAVCR